MYSFAIKWCWKVKPCKIKHVSVFQLKKSNYAKINMMFEIFAFLGCYAAKIGSYLPTFGTTYLVHLLQSWQPRKNYHKNLDYFLHIFSSTLLQHKQHLCLCFSKWSVCPQCFSLTHNCDSSVLHHFTLAPAILISWMMHKYYSSVHLI